MLGSHLHLGYNSIGDEGASYLAEALALPGEAEAV
jgi:hypothetical protein